MTSHARFTLLVSHTFPASIEDEMAYQLLKRDIAESVINAIDQSIPFEVETDASESALAATLN